MTSIWKNTAATLEMIKCEHSIFALPFALTATVLAAGTWPPLRVLVWIIVLSHRHAIAGTEWCGSGPKRCHSDAP